MTFRTLALSCLSLVLVLGRAHAAESDALAISANIQARHLPFGTIIDPIFAAANSDQIVGYTRCGDSAIWTGHYLAAEAFRYNVTRSPDAFNNLSRAIAGIRSLVDITGTDVLARCLVPLNSPFAAGIQSEEAHNGIYTNSAAGYSWVGNTSRDQYSGVMFGLGVAYDLVDDAGVKNSISLLVTRLLNFLLAHGWLVVMPDGSISTLFLLRPDQELALLAVGRHVNAGQFASAYSQLSGALAATVPVPIGVDVTSNDSYFKFNLDYINLYNLIRLEGGSGSSTYTLAYALLRRHTAPHQNAFFDIIDRGLNGPDAARDDEALGLLNAWLSRPRRDPSVDLHGLAGVCGSQACQPIPVPLRPPTDFLWQRDPFQLSGGGSGVIEGAGIDYILPYWMARYYGVDAPFVVQSAASISFTVAPDSIASLSGANLASTTAQAAAQPLPRTLGGVSVTVRGSAGAATFTVTHGATSLAGSTLVQNVAPARFTLVGNGVGVAAATAMQTLAGTPASQPVPVFQCAAAGCTAVPSLWESIRRSCMPGSSRSSPGSTR